DSNRLNETSDVDTPDSGHYTKRRPATSGCKLLTNTATRHSGRSHATIRRHNSAIMSSESVADRAPSTSQSITARMLFIADSNIKVTTNYIYESCREMRPAETVLPVGGNVRLWHKADITA